MDVGTQLVERAQGRTVRDLVAWGAAACSAGAAAIHFAVVGHHADEVWYFGAFLALVAWAQLGWALGIVIRPGRRLLAAGVALQAFVVSIYLLSRTTGLPVGPMPWHRSSVAWLDGLCVALEVVAGLAAAVLVVRRLDHPVSARLVVATLSATLVVLAGTTGGAVALADASSGGGMGDMVMTNTSGATMTPMKMGSGSTSMAAMGGSDASTGSTMGSMGSMAGGSTSSTMGAMAMGTTGSSSTMTSMAGMTGMAGTGGTTGTTMGNMDMGGSTSTTMPGMPGMPGMPSPGDGSFSLATTSAAGAIPWPGMAMTMEPGMAMAGPACTATPNAAQQAAAVSLVDQTVAATTRYRSLAAAKAAGYVPITPTGATVVHYLNFSNLAGTTLSSVLNPLAPQSLVYANTSTGPRLVAAMFVMPTGSTATPPSPGGCLTQWHIHTNLCFNSSNQVVATTDPAGDCPPGSVHRVTQPMLHVWLAPVPGGPLMVDEPDATVGTAASELPAADPPPVRA
jgi:hypothetical protein